MTEQQEKLISIEYLLDIIEDLLNDKYPYDLSILKQISINAKAKYEKQIIEAIEKGVKYTDGIISDERFPF
jgi:dihydropteroate synthase